jgi:hypothetical protein
VFGLDVLNMVFLKESYNDKIIIQFNGKDRFGDRKIGRYGHLIQE